MLGYQVLISQIFVFNTQIGTPFLPPSNLGIHPFMINPAPTAVILSELIRTHKHELRLFKKYHEVDQDCKQVISKLTPEK